MRGPPHKRRDSLADSIGTPLYTADPEPPFIFVVRDLVWACFDIDRARLAPHLPPDLTIADGSPAFLAIYFTDPQGWGITDMWGGFLSVAVNEYPSPDTAEAAFALSGFCTGPGRSLTDRHYWRSFPGRSRITHEGAETLAELLDDQDRPVARCRIRRTGAAPGHSTSLDRYLALNRHGDLTSHMISVDGEAFPAELLELEFTDNAPPSWQAARPTRLDWALFEPRMLTHQSEPVALRPGPGRDDPASPQAVLNLLDRQGRACAVVSATGQVLHLNLLARPFAARVGPSLSLSVSPQDRPRLAQALESAAAGLAGAVGSAFRLPDANGPPLILQLAPLAGERGDRARVLALIDDPWQPRPPPRPELLELLGLTPAEARIAAAVGAGLPPREAALRLGLAESTVRSSLKVIFDKLGLARQAELARLIARLEV